MRLKDIVNQYKIKANSSIPSEKYSALLFALQIPSIYGRIENPQNLWNTECDGMTSEERRETLYYANKRPKDKQIYTKWISDHKGSFKEWGLENYSIVDFANRIYDLRCNITHEGVLLDQKTPIFFSNSNTVIIDDKYIILSVKTFCETLFDAAVGNIDVTPFYELEMDNKTYRTVVHAIDKKYSAFWDKHTDIEYRLYLDFLRNYKNHPDKLAEAEKYFEQNTNSLYKGLTYEHLEKMKTINEDLEIYSMHDGGDIKLIQNIIDNLKVPQ